MKMKERKKVSTTQATIVLIASVVIATALLHPQLADAQATPRSPLVSPVGTPPFSPLRGPFGIEQQPSPLFTPPQQPTRNRRLP